MSALTSQQLSILQAHVAAGDRIAYYTQLADWGDRYAALCLGVVNNDTWAGATANIYFLQEVAENGGPQPFGWSNLASMSLDLMRADYAARETGGLDLPVDVIWGYHTSVFSDYDAPADAWTPSFALQHLATVEEREALWDSFLEVGALSGSAGDWYNLFATTLSSSVVGYDDYIADVAAAAALGLTAPSTDYGPFSVALPNGGSVIGGNYLPDTLVGTTKDNVIIGFDGDDTLAGWAGQDRLYGGEGNDTLVGGWGFDKIVGGAGDDVVWTGDYDPEEVDYWHVFYGSNDLVFTGDGDDDVHFDGGKDIISLGAGDDEVYLPLVYSRTVIWGGSGADAYHFESSAHIMFVNAPDVSDRLLENLDVDALFAQYNDGAEYPVDYIIINPEANDRFFLGDTELGQANVEETRQDYELDWTKKYTDTGIVDGDGNRVFIETQLFKIDGYSLDRLFKFDVDPDLWVQLRNDDGSNSVHINDLTIEGFVDGDAGMTFVGSGPRYETHDTFTTQLIDTSGYVTTTIRWDPFENIVYYEHAAYDLVGSETTTIEDYLDDDVKPTNWSTGTRDTIYLSDYQRDPNGNGDTPVITGSPFGDEIPGSDGDDVILAAAGDDIVDGGAGDDQISGEAGSDELFGSDGADILIGGTDDDFSNGGSGGDTYRYGAGDGDDTIEDWGDAASLDVVELGSGISKADVTISRGDGDFWDLKLGFSSGGSLTVKAGFIGAGTVIEAVRFADSSVWSANDIREIYLDKSATSGNDFIHGFVDTSDTISGKGGNDEIYGYSGNDMLYGNGGNDVLLGQEGVDTLNGGVGDDFLVGGAGADVYVFASTNEGADWIDDFSTGVDRIDLSAISSMEDLGDVLGVAEEWGGTTWLNFSQNNSIRLQNVSLASLSAGDFIFA
jgi:Ca2+-binding RTX toxin-like protein